MLWFFERDNTSLQLETRYDNQSEEIVVTVRRPDQPSRIERFKDLASCRDRLLALERELKAERWEPRQGGPVVLPYGWPEKP
jgi:hypothetical protein